MAQGAIKKSSKPFSASSSTKRSKSLVLKKGRRTIAPKKAVLVKARGITKLTPSTSYAEILKKHSAGLTARTEKNLAQRVGHLELLPGGKKIGGEKDKEMGKRRK